MIAMLVYLGSLNIIDAFATFYGLSRKAMEEANPLMHGLYSISPTLFLSTKVILSILLFALILHNKIPNNRLFRTLSFGSSIIYTFVCLIHLTWMTGVL